MLMRNSASNLLYVISILGLLICSSCSKKLTYFTEDLSSQYDWTEAELKRIQFYLSQDIELFKTAKGGDSRIEDGQIKIKSRKKVDKVLIKKGTPGTLIFSPKDNRYAVSFDSKSDYLMFGPSKRNNGRYTLLAKKWKDRNGVGIISYGDEEYYTDSESAYAALLVDLKKARHSVVKTKTASGRKIN